MLRLINKFFGYYTVKASTENAPLLLNACKEKSIRVISTMPCGDYIYFTLGLFHCQSFLFLASEMGIDTEIVSETGLPFVLSRYKSRYGIYLGLVLSMAFLLYSSMLLWDIKVTGNVTLTESEILQVISRYGIHIGTFIPRIDADRTAEYILIDYSPLSSLAINVKGTTATVDVIERATKPEDTFPKDGVCNLAAGWDGIVTKVQAHEGTPQVKVGQVVTEGQLLINGVVENRYGAFKLVNASGYVFADVNTDVVFEIPLAKETKEYTGNKKVKREICFLGYTIPLYIKTDCGYQSYDVLGSNKDITVFGLKTPFKISEAVYKEYKKADYEITERQAEKEAEERFKTWCLKECEGEIVSVQTESEIKDNSYFFKARVVVNKNIAVRKEILFTPRKLP